MKRYFLMLFVVMLFFSACEKQKIANGTRDIARSWQVVKYTINGTVATSTFKSTYTDYTITFDEIGNYTESYTVLGLLYSINGTWLFQNNVNEIKLIDSAQTRIYEILELNGGHLNVKYTGNGDDEVYNLEPV